ncbi:hypothetical protein O181_090109 [Austropuccinia psidii MF-1]|uniref:Uncharacterized protein n=1 Tax=Austropuccinia psidii MF-1 TaxID=1389203 RepID=A0A9Q3IUT2_9BASI|nr:hypothetical protein [Austropuccinia psidii MF-1]
MDLPPLSFHASVEEQWDEEEEPEGIETVLKVVPPAYHQYLDLFSKVKEEKLPPHCAQNHYIKLEGLLPQECREGFDQAKLPFNHQGKSCVNRRRLTSRQANVKQDKSRAHIKQKSSERQAHVLLLSYTKSCDIHQYWFPCAFNSDSSPPDHPATV